MAILKLSGVSDEAGQDIHAQIKAHKELGWDLIDLRVVDGKNVSDASDEQFDRIHEAVTGAGLQVSNFASGICCWSRSIHADFNLDREEMKRAIPRMRRFGAKTLRIMSCPNDKGRPAPSDQEWKTEAIRRIRELARMAEDAGVILVHENAGGWAGNNPDKMLELLDAVSSPNLMLLFDMGNFRTREASWDAFLKTREKIAHVHIKDRTEKGPTFPGQGFIPVKEIALALARSGYDGAVSIEPHIAAVHHTGATAPPEVLYETYVRYGRMAAKIVEEANKEASTPCP